MRQIKARARGSFPALAAAALGVCCHVAGAGGECGKTSSPARLGALKKKSGLRRGVLRGKADLVTRQRGRAAGTSLPGQCRLFASPAASHPLRAWAGLWDVHWPFSSQRSEGCSCFPGLVLCARSSELTVGVSGATCAPNRQGHGAGNEESPQVSWGRIPAVLVSAPTSYTQSTVMYSVASGAIWGGYVVMASTDLDHA